MPKLPPIHLHLGPARAGKAAMMRRHYLDLVAAVGPTEVVFLVPTGQRRTATLQVLLKDSGRSVLWQPQVWTFPRYAEELLRRLHAPARRLAPVQQQAFLERAVADARQDGALTYFAPIVDRPGFLDSVADLIHQLKSRAVPPEVFLRTVRRGRPAVREMASVYARYHKLLADAGLYDDAGLFWQLKDVLAAALSSGVVPQEVLVDGFQDFSPPERDILVLLREAGARLTVTLPCDPARPKVFAWTMRTLEALQVAFGAAIVVHPPDAPPARTAGTLAHFEQHLWDDSAAGQTPTPSDAVQFIEAHGTAREVESLARTIKQLLHRDPSLRPADVAVIMRSAQPYRRLVADIFPRYGLPLGDPVDTPLATCPLTQWLLALLHLPCENYRYRDLAAVLRSPFFPQEAFEATEADLEAADRFLLRLGVFEDMDHHRRALRLHAAERSSRATDAEDETDRVAAASEAEAARRVEALFGRLAERLGRWPTRATRSRYVAELSALVDTCQLSAAVAAGTDLETVARDMASLQSLHEMLDQMVRLADWLEEEPIGYAEFLSELENAVARTVVSGSTPLGSGVRLLDVWSSRALSFPVVVLPGLNHGLWPRPESRHLLDTPENRGSLQAAGLLITTREEQLAEERFLFYMAVTRASRQLILSRPAADDEGRPQLASVFWNELQRLATGAEGAPTVVQVSANDVDLRPEEAASREELRRVVFARLTSGTKHSADLLDAWMGVDSAAPALLASTAVIHERESSEPFGRFDGVLSAPDIVSELAAEFPARHVFSTSRLEDYVQCPFRFLAITVLGLEPRELPEEYFLEADVGDIYHEALRRFYQVRLTAGQTQLTKVSPEVLHREMDEAVRRVFAEREATGEGGLPALWMIQQEEILRCLSDYVDEELERCRASSWAIEPRFLEWAFGSKPRRGEDAAAMPQPLVIPSPHGPVLVRGRVDRVDMLIGSTGAEGLAVVDYKSGTKPGGLAGRIEAGQALQLPLYLMAVQAAFSASLGAAPAQGLYYYLRDLSVYAALDALGNDKKAARFAPIMEATRETVASIIDRVRSGHFPPVPADACPAYCEFRSICRTARWRVERKVPRLTEDPGATD
jgi:ATP-dependent helicase/nuclease subunit B